MALYIGTHRQIDNWNTRFYVPLLLSNQEANIALKVRDKYPEMASMNLYWNELCGFKFIWKEDFGAYKGFLQYRMLPNMPYEEIMDTLDKYDYIAHTDLVGHLMKQFCMWHSPDGKVWNLLIQVLKDLNVATDEQLKTWANSEWLYSRNTLIAKARDFDDYCAWIFPIIDEFTKRMGFNTMDDVMAWAEQDKSHGGPKDRARLAGYISERLATLYFLIKYGTFEEAKNHIYIPEYSWVPKMELG